jgi:exodeoxyribonuclease V alpha subunit
MTQHSVCPLAAAISSRPGYSTSLRVHCEVKLKKVVFDDRVVLYGFDNLDDLALAYATKVHKAQGSEYPAIVLPLLPQDYLMLQRNLLYTAVTRGKQIVVIVGDPRAVGRAVHNDKIARRNTRLAERLRNEL